MEIYPTQDTQKIAFALGIPNPETSRKALYHTGLTHWAADDLPLPETSWALSPVEAHFSIQVVAQFDGTTASADKNP